jgi:hypothetical protein
VEFGSQGVGLTRPDRRQIDAPSGCSPLYCGSDGNMGNPLAIAFGDPAAPSTGLLGHPDRIKDFGYRAIHLMTVRGKQIAKSIHQPARTTGQVTLGMRCPSDPHPAAEL